MELCKTCREFDLQAFAKGGPDYRGYDLGETVRAAQHDCSFCSLLIDNLLAVTQGPNLRLLKDTIRRESGREQASDKALSWLSGETWASVRLWTYNQFFPAWINLSVERADAVATLEREPLSILAINSFISYSTGYHGQLEQRRTIRLNTAADEGTPAHTSKDIVGKLYAQESTWSSSHVEAVKSWHQNCRMNHPECNKTFSRAERIDVENVPLPTRCLEVTMDRTGPAAATCRYVLRRTAGQSGKYTILSHRWGEDTKSCRTTKANLRCILGECSQSCILCSGNIPPITNLFKDMAMLSADIGVTYIWIDSLCIIQDDSEDWDRESVKMAQYYQQAYLTVAATTVSTLGLFGPISQEYHPRVTRLPYRGQDGIQQGYFYLQCLEEQFLTSDYEANIRKSSLLRRGWVFQEWTLSRRLLAFSGTGGLFVQCQREAPRSLYGDPVRKTGPRDTLFRVRLDLNDSHVREILASWLNAVETYSGLELTKFAKDRFAALSGLAREFQKMLDQRYDQTGIASRYVSGLWFHYHRGLLWEQAAPGERARVGGIPTWSWASMSVPAKNEQGSDLLDDKGERIFRGLQVRWATRLARTTYICQFEDCRTIDMVPGSFEPRFENPSAVQPGDAYGTTDRFVMLKMRGRILPFQVHGPFNCTEDADITAAMTDHQPNIGRGMWRRITVSAQPGDITGWASLEHPDFQTDVTFEPNNTIQALVVSITSKDWGGYGIRSWRGHQKVFSLLFIRPITGLSALADVYERVGCGRVFGGEVALMLEQASDQPLWLA